MYRAGALHERAGQWSHHQLGGRRIGFGVVGGGVAEDVAGLLEHGVLEAAAGAEEWRAGFAGVADRAERGLRVGVGTGRHAPEAMIDGKEVAGRVGNRSGVEPGRSQIEPGGGEGQGAGDGLVGGDRRIEVPRSIR